MQPEVLKSGNVQWVVLEGQNETSVAYLRERYRFHPLDYEDVLAVGQRNKIDRYPDYLFLVLLLPRYNREQRDIEPVELNVFITNDTIITITQGTVPSLTEFYRLCKENAPQRERFFGASVDRLAMEILTRLLLANFPMLDHINQDIERIEQRIFAGQERQMVREILIIRRNITDFRRIIQGHKYLFEKTLGLSSGKPELDAQRFRLTPVDRAAYGSLIDLTRECWDTLSGYKESIEALQATNESLISSQINQVMRMLTAISVIILPVGVIAGLFGANVQHIPFAGASYDFLFLVSLSVATMVGMIIFLHRKHWL